jgi:hypothetical protein
MRVRFYLELLIWNEKTPYAVEYDCKDEATMKTTYAELSKLMAEKNTHQWCEDQDLEGGFIQEIRGMFKETTEEVK